jgi:anti-anti-sigma regulatory factor
MLRITRADEGAGRTTLRLEGRLTASELDALDQACGACRDEERRLRLDLGGVRFVDGDAARVLRALAAGPVEMTGCSPFVVELLKEVPR